MDLKRTAFGLLALWGVTSGALFSPLGTAFAGVAGVVGYLGYRRVNQAQDRTLVTSLAGLATGTAYAVGSYIEQRQEEMPPAKPVENMKVTQKNTGRCVLAGEEADKKHPQKRLRESLGIQTKTVAEMRLDKDENTYFHWKGPNNEIYVYDISENYKTAVIFNLNAQLRQEGRPAQGIEDIVVQYESDVWIPFSVDAVFIKSIGKFPQVDLDKLAYMYTLDQFHKTLGKGGIIEFAMQENGDIDTTFYKTPMPASLARKIKCLIDNKTGCHLCNNMANVVTGTSE